MIAPHGGSLRNLLLDPAAAEQAKAESISSPSIALSEREICDLEQLQNGGFSPLQGFMRRADYEAVLEAMRLSDGTLWPIPVTLGIPLPQAEALQLGGHAALLDAEGLMLARVRVEELWQPDPVREAEAVYGTADPQHPGVRQLLESPPRAYVGGAVEGLQPAAHPDFRELRFTPAEVRAEFQRRGWLRVAAFQTRNPLHRAHMEMTVRAATQADAHLLLHPVVGPTKLGDIDHYTRVRCYQAILGHYPPGLAMLSLLNLAMRMAGPREALWHAIIRQNYGCSHFIVGRDHAGPGNDSRGRPFYGPYAAQELVAGHADDLSIRMIPFQELVYSRKRAQYVPSDQVQQDEEILSISGTELRRRLREGLDLPDWFTYPEVVVELRKAHPARHEQGLTLFFTGLSGAGKSTIAKVILAKFMEIGERPVTLLDGDIVRRVLSSELGFSREHRDLNILRIGFVANEISKNGGIAICAAIAPYASVRRQVRELVSLHGAFIEVYVSTPLEVCEARDRKGMYAKARAGLIPNFTGVSDPYEVPENPEITIDTSALTPEQAAGEITLFLEREKYLV